MTSYKLFYRRPEDMEACRLERQRRFFGYADLLRWIRNEVRASRLIMSYAVENGKVSRVLFPHQLAS